MVKAGQVAKKGKKGAVEQLNKPITPAKNKTPAKAKPVAAQQKQQKKSKGPKVAVKKEESDDDEEEETEDSGAELKEVIKTEDGDSENDSENEEVEENAELEDSDSDDAESENEIKQEMDNNSDADEQENEDDDDDDAPEEKPINKKTENQNQPQSKSKNSVINNENRDRRIYVKRIDANTTEADIKEHFSTCGEIEAIKISKGQRFKFDAIVVFKEGSSCQEALKFHNTILNDSTILVEHASTERPKSDEQRSVIMVNSDHLTKLEGSVIKEIFSECGEIEHLNVVCEKNVLAYITFKEASAVPKAMELNGTSFEDKLKIEIAPYKSNRKVQKSKVFVKNIANGVTEEDLTKMFEVCGSVVSVSLRRNNTGMGTAIVQFETEDGYCKAFLMHEEKLRGRSLFIEPFSNPKKFGSNKPNNQGKRPASNNWKGGPPKKFQKQK